MLANGTTPVMPPIDGLADVGAWDNRDATSTSTVPRRFLVLGGGPIGVELAQAFRRLGSEEVTVVEGGQRLLAREEPFVGEELAAAFDAEGIVVRTGVSATAATRDERGVRLTLSDGSTVEGDQLLVAVGRRANTGDVGLETVGLDPADRIAVDERLRVRGVPGEWLYAVGDVAGLAQLTHMGKYQGRLAGDVIAGRDAVDESDHRAMPRVTFTDPQVAAVGPTEAEAREAGIDVRVLRVGTGDVAGAYVRGNDIAGTSQLVIDDVPTRGRRRHLHRSRRAGDAARRDDRDRGRGAAGAAVARGAGVPDRERGLAPSARGLRALIDPLSRPVATRPRVG